MDFLLYIDDCVSGHVHMGAIGYCGLWRLTYVRTGIERMGVCGTNSEGRKVSFGKKYLRMVRRPDKRQGTPKKPYSTTVGGHTALHYPRVSTQSHISFNQNKRSSPPPPIRPLGFSPAPLSPTTYTPIKIRTNQFIQHPKVFWNNLPSQSSHTNHRSLIN